MPRSHLWLPRCRLIWGGGTEGWRGGLSFASVRRALGTGRRPVKRFKPTRERLPNKSVPWIRRIFDRNSRFSLIPGLTSWKQIDCVLLMLTTSGVTAICTMAPDQVMKALFTMIIPRSDEFDFRKYWTLPLGAWLASYDMPFFGWHWIVSLGLPLATRMSSMQMAFLYSACGAAGMMAQARCLDVHARDPIGSEFGWQINTEQSSVLIGSTPAINGLKGALVAHWLETFKIFYPVLPPIIPSLVTGASIWTIVFFYSDLMPHRIERMRFEGVAETVVDRSKLRGNQTGFLVGLALFALLSARGRLIPAVRY